LNWTPPSSELSGLTQDSQDSQVDQLRTFLGIHFTATATAGSAKGEARQPKGLKLTSELKALKNFFDFPLKSLDQRSRSHKKVETKAMVIKIIIHNPQKCNFFRRERRAGKKN